MKILIQKIAKKSPKNENFGTKTTKKFPQMKTLMQNFRNPSKMKSFDTKNYNKSSHIKNFYKKLYKRKNLMQKSYKNFPQMKNLHKKIIHS
jgi:hypothetical protein